MNALQRSGGRRNSAKATQQRRREREADKEGRRLVPQFRRKVKNMAADIIKTLAEWGGRKLM